MVNEDLSAANCVFDAIISGRAPGYLVLDEPEVLAFLDTRPVFPGHTLVVPRAHFATVADLPEVLVPALWGAARRVAAAQREALGCEGTFFALNDVVSQSVPHVHLHVVPRKRKDGLRGFFWPRTRYGNDEAEAVAAAVRRALGTAATPLRAQVGAEISVRDAVPADAAALAEILAAGNLRGEETAADPAPYRAVIEDPATTILVAELHGEVVGVCQLIIFRHLQQRGGLCAELESAHVDAPHRGRGVGSALVAEAVTRARRAGCYRVQLTSNKVRAHAHRFWAAQGFVASHEGFKLYL